MDDELLALGFVVGRGDEVADVGLLELLGGFDDGVELGQVLVRFALALDLHLLLVEKRMGHAQ